VWKGRRGSGGPGTFLDQLAPSNRRPVGPVPSASWPAGKIRGHGEIFTTNGRVRLNQGTSMGWTVSSRPGRPVGPVDLDESGRIQRARPVGPVNPRPVGPESLTSWPRKGSTSGSCGLGRIRPNSACSTSWPCQSSTSWSRGDFERARPVGPVNPRPVGPEYLIILR
jgi:hypothetical protein